MLDRIVNLRLLSHPLNYLIVWTVLLFAVFAWTLVHEKTSHPLTGTTES